MEWEALFKFVAGSGVGVTFLLFALQWLNKDRDKLLGSLDAERNNRIMLLEQSSQRCAEDRRILHEEVSGLQTEVRTLLKQMATNAPMCGAACLRKNLEDEST